MRGAVDEAVVCREKAELKFYVIYSQSLRY